MDGIYEGVLIMGLFGFGKKKEQKTNTSGVPKVEYFKPTWTDTAVSKSPLEAYRCVCKIPMLRYVPMPSVECYNHWTGKRDCRPLIDPECEMAKKYTEVYFLHALPISGYEDLFYPFSDKTMHLVEETIEKFEEINNIAEIREYMAEHSDNEVIVATGEWFLGDYLNCKSDTDYPNDATFWDKMKEREIRLYGKKEIL